MSGAGELKPVAVKPLEWTTDGRTSKASCEFGEYTVEPSLHFKNLFAVWKPGDDVNRDWSFEARTLQKAKAIAQNDYESRIRSALVSPDRALVDRVERLKSENHKMRLALGEFAAFASDNVEVLPNSEVDPDNFTVADGYCWNDTNVSRDRIVDWFGPTAFGFARAVLTILPEEGDKS